MRLSITALLGAVVCIASLRTQCAKTNDLENIVSGTICGCKKAIINCMSAEQDLWRYDEVLACYISGGCNRPDAKIAALWFYSDCNSPRQNDNLERELKRRQDTIAESAQDETTAQEQTAAAEESTQQQTSEEKTSIKQSTESTQEESTASASKGPSSTDATKTSESSANTQTSTPPSTITQTTGSTTESSYTSSTGTSSALTITTGTLLCSLTSTKSTQICSVSGRRTLFCSPTVTAIASCAPGNICFNDRKGGPICMKRDNSLRPDGIAVAIAFPACVVAVALAIVAIHYRDKKKRRNERERKAAAAAAASTRKVKYFNAGSSGDAEGGGTERSRAHGQDDDVSPLMDPRGPRSDHDGYYQQQYFHQNHGSGYETAMNPQAPRLHQGLGTLTQEGVGNEHSNLHWSEDYGRGR